MDITIVFLLMNGVMIFTVLWLLIGHHYIDARNLRSDTIFFGE